MVLGWKISYEKKLPKEGISNWEVFAIAEQACKQLEWEYLIADKKTFTATTPTHWTLNEDIITISVDEEQIIFRSQSESFDLYEAGRNQKNIEEEFLPAFKAAKKKLQGEQLQNVASNLEADTLQQLSSGSRVATERITFGFKDHEVTFCLMLANIIVFLLMSYRGVNVYEPSPHDITVWGGNVKEFVQAGEWWRLVTNLFIHIGLAPLLVNLFGLYFIGIIVETILGKLKYLIAYIISGGLASLVSIYYAGFGVTAGASGAIAGMYGVLLAFAATSYINKKFNWIWLAGIVLYALINVGVGLQGGVDTVANVGGLIAGVAVGYLYYWFHYRRNLARAGGTRISIEIVLIAVLLVYFYVRSDTKDDSLRFERAVMKLNQIELKAMTQIQRLPNAETNAEAARILKDSTMPEWKRFQKELLKTDRYHLDEKFKKKRKLLSEYAQLRLKQTQLIYKSILEETTGYDKEVNEVSDKIERIIDQMGE